MRKVTLLLIVFLLMMPLGFAEIKVSVERNVNQQLLNSTFDLEQVTKHGYIGNIPYKQTYYVFKGMKGMNLNSQYLEGVESISIVNTLAVCGLWNPASPKTGSIITISNPPSGSVQAAQIHQPIINLFSNKPTVPINNTPYSYRGDYKYTGFVHFYGNINKSRIMSIIYSINSSYFEGLNDLSFTYSNHQDVHDGNERGKYYVNGDWSKIDFWIYNENDGQIKYWLLHELAHHSCFVKGYKWTSVEESHQGCFPIEFKKLLNNFN